MWQLHLDPQVEYREAVQQGGQYTQELACGTKYKVQRWVQRGEVQAA